MPEHIVARYRQVHKPWKQLCAASAAETRQKRLAALLRSKRELVTQLEKLGRIGGKEDAAPVKKNGLSKKRPATAEEKDEDDVREDAVPAKAAKLDGLRWISGKEDAAPAKKQGLPKTRPATKEERDEDEEREDAAPAKKRGIARKSPATAGVKEDAEGRPQDNKVA